MKILQINLHRSKAASANLILHLAKDGVDAVLIQEPWTVENKVRGIRANGYRTFVLTNQGRPRSCILMRNEFNASLIHRFSDNDTTAISLSLGKDQRDLWLVSSYMAHDHAEAPPPKCVRDIVSEAKGRGNSVVIGADANAHHVLWASTDTNERGESLFNFIISENLSLCNKGEEPTFVTSVRKEVLDLTLLLNSGNVNVYDWRVLDEHSFSDHRYLQFRVGIEPLKRVFFKNYRKTNWISYRRLLRERLGSRPRDPVCVSELDELVEYFTSACNWALEESCRSTSFSAGRRRRKPHWWNMELSDLRSSTRRLFNRAKASGRETDWAVYKTSLGLYKGEIRKAKRSAWRSFCESIEGEGQTARFRKLLSKESPCGGFIGRGDGTWALSSEESLGILLDTHFPGSGERTCDRPGGLCGSPLGPDTVRVIVDRRKLLWAVRGFRPYKSAGPDGIIPAQLQEALYLTCSWMEVIFRGCLLLGVIPGAWRKTRVVFIPKAGKCSHVGPKDFRPISLSSFVLKTLERLLELYLRGCIPRGLMSESQHAYTRGRSVETALYSVVSTIEGSLEGGDYALGVFLDIQGAFNDILPSAILRSLRDLGVDVAVTDLIGGLLVQRTISAEWAGVTTERRVSRGTPQGGVLSPLLWLASVNGLLRELESTGGRVVAYADDIAIICTGRDLGVLSRRMTRLLERVSGWVGERGLSLNPLKTEAVLFSRRYKVPEFEPPSLGGVQLQLESQVRYLGIILDRKLSWRPNVEERVRKASVALYCCRGAIGRRWGLSPRAMMWIFRAIIRPILFYGVVVWWRSLRKKYIADSLMKIQRSALLSVSGAMRTTSSLALCAILNTWTPDIMAEATASASLVRIRECGVGSTEHLEDSGLLRRIGSIPVKTDYCVPYLLPVTRLRTFIPNRNEWKRSLEGDTSSIRFFTDGSKLDSRVGYGVYSPDLGLNISLRLPDHCSVFQAEIAAILEVAKLLESSVMTCRRICIYTDSQAAIKSLESTFAKSRIVRECHSSLRIVAGYYDIRLIWVPGHSDVPGNCMADELARLGTTAQFLTAGEGIGVPISTCRVRICQWADRELSEKWRRTQTCKQARFLWPRVDGKRTGQLLRLPRRKLSSVLGAITGHCLVGNHALRLGLRDSTLCRCCLEEELETTVHLLLDCPALAGLRYRVLGGHVIDIKTLLEVPMGLVGKFIERANWLDD